jgi:hypothetical protein
VPAVVAIVALPFASVVPESVDVVPSGAVTTTLTESLASGVVPFIEFTTTLKAVPLTPEVTLKLAVMVRVGVTCFQSQYSIRATMKIIPRITIATKLIVSTPLLVKAVSEI